MEFPFKKHKSTVKKEGDDDFAFVPFLPTDTEKGEEIEIEEEEFDDNEDDNFGFDDFEEEEEEEEKEPPPKDDKEKGEEEVEEEGEEELLAFTLKDTFDQFVSQKKKEARKGTKKSQAKATVESTRKSARKKREIKPCMTPSAEVADKFRSQCQLSGAPVDCSEELCAPEDIETLPESGSVGEMVAAEFLKSGAIGFKFDEKDLNSLKTRGDNGIDMVGMGSTEKEKKGFFIEVKTTTGEKPPPLSPAQGRVTKKDKEQKKGTSKEDLRATKVDNFVSSRLNDILRNTEHDDFDKAKEMKEFRDNHKDDCQYLVINVYLPKVPGKGQPVSVEVVDWRTGKVLQEKDVVLPDSDMLKYETPKQRGDKGEQQIKKCLAKLGIIPIDDLQYEGAHGVDIVAEEDEKVCFLECKTTTRDDPPAMSKAQKKPEQYVTSRMKKLLKRKPEKKKEVDRVLEKQLDTDEMGEPTAAYLKVDFHVPTVGNTGKANMDVYPWDPNDGVK